MRTTFENQPTTAKKEKTIELIDAFNPIQYVFKSTYKDTYGKIYKSKVQTVRYLADRVFIEGYNHRTCTIPYVEIESIEINSDNELIIEVKNRGVLTLKTY